MRPASLSCAAFVAALLTTSIAAQDGPRPSQLGSVTQQVNQTRITIDYSRPLVRGRELFGQLVPWGKTWTPGANDATTIALSTDVQVNGQKLAAGTYTVWSEPGKDQWAIIFNTAHPVWHLKHDEFAGKDVLRVAAKPRTGAHMETLAWYFPVVDGRKAELVAHWGTVVVPLQIDVP